MQWSYRPSPGAWCFHLQRVYFCWWRPGWCRSQWSCPCAPCFLTKSSPSSSLWTSWWVPTASWLAVLFSSCGSLCLWSTALERNGYWWYSRIRDLQGLEAHKQRICKSLSHSPPFRKWYPATLPMKSSPQGFRQNPCWTTQSWALVLLRCFFTGIQNHCSYHPHTSSTYSFD